MKNSPPKGNASKHAPHDLAAAISVEASAAQSKMYAEDPPEINVRLQNHETENLERSEDLALNAVIRYQTEAIGFKAYQTFINNLMDAMAKKGMHSGAAVFDTLNALPREHTGAGHSPVVKLHGTLVYDVLRMATEAFLLTRCGPTCGDFFDSQERSDSWNEFANEDAERLGMSKSSYRNKLQNYLAQLPRDGQAATPYLELIVDQLALVPPSGDPLTMLYASRYECPLMIELIWSYWHEEGMLSQTMAAIGIRFQNRRASQGKDPLVNLETDVLRPLNNLLWGWIQSEYRRLSVQRRAYEYDHHYGMTLIGKAVPPLLSADSRSKFLESFHTLLCMAHKYFEDASNTTIIPDGFPLLNALRGTHLVLAEGAHNQYGDLPWTARVEMLIEQWLLARTEMREFLRSRPMVPYQEAWMGQVDAMKKLQDWSDVGITHFHELAACGEAILLSVRHGPWATSNNQASAKAWADYWRPEIQRYLYAYKAVTGVDLTLEPPNNTVPARLLSERLQLQRQQVGYGR